MKGNAIRVLKEMTEVFLLRHVARSAAALSYYFTLTVFPFLICVSAIVGSIEVHDAGAMDHLVDDLIPSESFAVITDFLQYVGNNRSDIMLFFGITAMLMTCSAAFRSFTGIMYEIQEKKRYSSFFRGILSFFFSLLFLVAIYAAGLVMLSGAWLMGILETHFGYGELIALWTWIRFVILFLLLFGVIYGVYTLTASGEIKKRQCLPGALIASIVLVVTSIVFSQLISESLRYQVLYGSLASFVILMVWLYLCGVILIMGNVFNISLSKGISLNVRNVNHSMK